MTIIAKPLHRDATEARAWAIVFLLWLFMLINFADKAILGLAAVPIMHDLALTPSAFGLLGSSFFFLFAASAIGTGFIVNRVGTKWPIFIMAMIWTAVQVPMIASVGFTALMTCRIILGAGEGPAYPTAVHSIYNWFANKRRVLPTAILALGATAGLLAAPALTYVITHASWHWAFFALGMLSLAWALAWLTIGGEGPAAPTVPQDGAHTASGISYFRLLTTPTTLATIICGFVAYSGLSLLFVWFTPYLNVGLGYSAAYAGWLTTLPAASSGAVMAIGGWLSQRALLRGASTRLARGLPAGLGVTLGGIAIYLVPFCHSSEIKIAMMVLGVGLPSLIYVLAHPIVSEFTPVPQRAAVLAITNAAITLAGIVAPYAMGWIIQGSVSAQAGYERGFLVCGATTVVGGIVGVFFLHPENELARFARRGPPAAGAQHSGPLAIIDTVRGA